MSENPPHYTAKLPKMKSRLKKFGSTAQIMPGTCYLYEPNRKHLHIATEVTGRLLLKCYPNHDIRLLMEDVRVQPEDGSGPRPGPGGPVEFAFGPAAED